MRIIHFADLHIGVETYGRVDPATGLSTRLQDFLRAYDELVEFAIRERVDLVLFCGDAYKSRDPSQTHQREFARRIAKLSLAGIPVFLLTGNHDLPNAVGRATALEIFQTIPLNNVHVASRIGTYVVETRAGPLQVVAAPWVTHSRLLSVEEHKNVPADQVHHLMEERITQSIRHEIEGLDLALPAVFAGHLALPLAVAGSEKGMALGRDPVIQKSELDNPAFDYVALGHIHKRQEFDGLAPVVYSGSLQRVDFGEGDVFEFWGNSMRQRRVAEEKGFYVVEIDPERRSGERLRSHRFVPANARPFITMNIKVRGDNPTDEALRAITRIPVRDAIVRMQLRMSRASAAHFDEAEVRRALSGVHYLAGIAREMDEEARAARLGGVSIHDLTPLRSLELYLETKKTAPQRAKELINMARRLMDEEPK